MIRTNNTLNKFYHQCANLKKVKLLSDFKEYIPKCHFTSSETITGNHKARHLYLQLKSSGPISVAKFMEEALSNPSYGYYMQKDMIGKHGDFITSPELSQVFGELVAIWMINEWIANSSPSEVQIVELGPGRGTLIEDVMRTFHDLAKSMNPTNITFNLVEISSSLSQIQYQRLCGATEDQKKFASDSDNCYLYGTTKHNHTVKWYKQLQDVPTGKFSLFFAHEFFDALPVHKFVKDKDCWKEVFIDISSQEQYQFRYVLLPKQTLACKTLIKPSEKRDHVEVSPEAGIIVQEIGKRLVADGGGALIADYGHYGTKGDTLRAFKSHQAVDELSNFGECDLTADVDFLYLENAAIQSRVSTYGPITQHLFLKNMGIDTRIMMLLRNCKDSHSRRKIIGCYDLLVNPSHMGEIFKFFAMVPGSRQALAESHNIPVTAFI